MKISGKNLELQNGIKKESEMEAAKVAIKNIK